MVKYCKHLMKLFEFYLAIYMQISSANLMIPIF